MVLDPEFELIDLPPSVGYIFLSEKEPIWSKCNYRNYTHFNLIDPKLKKLTINISSNDLVLDVACNNLKEIELNGRCSLFFNTAKSPKELKIILNGEFSIENSMFLTIVESKRPIIYKDKFYANFEKDLYYICDKKVCSESEWIIRQLIE